MDLNAKRIPLSNPRSWRIQSVLFWRLVPITCISSTYTRIIINSPCKSLLNIEQSCRGWTYCVYFFSSLCCFFYFVQCLILMNINIWPFCWRWSNLKLWDMKQYSWENVHSLEGDDQGDIGIRGLRGNGERSKPKPCIPRL